MSTLSTTTDSGTRHPPRPTANHPSHSMEMCTRRSLRLMSCLVMVDGHTTLPINHAERNVPRLHKSLSPSYESVESVSEHRCTTFSYNEGNHFPHLCSTGTTHRTIVQATSGTRTHRRGYASPTRVRPDAMCTRSLGWRRHHRRWHDARGRGLGRPCEV